MTDETKPAGTIGSMLLCGTCHASRSSCQGLHEAASAGRCDVCGRPSDRIACEMAMDQFRRVQILLYRSTARAEYPPNKKR